MPKYRMDHQYPLQLHLRLHLVGSDTSHLEFETRMDLLRFFMSTTLRIRQRNRFTTWIFLETKIHFEIILRLITRLLRLSNEVKKNLNIPGGRESNELS